MRRYFAKGVAARLPFMAAPSFTPRDSADFCISIDFQSGGSSPSRVFRAMSELIDAFQRTDETLVQIFNSRMEPSLVLASIEVGPLRTWLRQTLASIDDEALKGVDLAKAIGTYLVQAKRTILNFLSGRTAITDNDLRGLEREIVALAARTDVKYLPSYEPVSRRALLEDIQRIIQALKSLEAGDRAVFTSGRDTAALNPNLTLSAEAIDALTVSETQDHKATLVMKVKKPDFIGDSMWQFHHDNHILDVKIADEAWLRSYQDGNIPVLPGDAIRAHLDIQVKYGHDLEVVGMHYTAADVEAVIPKQKHVQGSLFEDGDIAGITVNRQTVHVKEIAS